MQFDRITGKIEKNKFSYKMYKIQLILLFRLNNYINLQKQNIQHHIHKHGHMIDTGILYESTIRDELESKAIIAER